MDINDIVKLIQAVSENSLTSFELKEGDTKLTLKRETPQIVSVPGNGHRRGGHRGCERGSSGSGAGAGCGSCEGDGHRLRQGGDFPAGGNLLHGLLHRRPSRLSRWATR